MKLSETEFWLCAFYFGYTEIPGIAAIEINQQNIDREKIRRHLSDQKVMELENETYAFTPLGHHIFHTIGDTDAYMRIEGKARKRRIYIKNQNYICIDQKEGQVKIYLLPSLPLVIGAYADALEEPEVELEGKVGQEEIKLQIVCSKEGRVVYKKCGKTESHKEYEKANCVNDVTLWLLSSLGKKWGRING
ncbi:hypothetical protein [Robinsoniella sp. KNHs210]|uniref:hypothetical protein n=1 Tax=Robinsoniella sp. KNHs210 TaxID=1469950 RepID=UPI0004887FA7|nr:hypothetical protein [Robinsoniella sp. KNHs210]